MRDTSLDDFIGEDDGDSDGDDETGDDARATVGSVEGDGEECADHDTDASGEERAKGDEPDEGAAATADVPPAVSTYEWTPDGATCTECDVVVERRWRDGGVLVCADCKDW